MVDVLVDHYVHNRNAACRRDSVLSRKNGGLRAARPTYSVLFFKNLLYFYNYCPLIFKLPLTELKLISGPPAP